jgi:anthranilate synthase component II
MPLVIIDNYDSFTYNLYQLVQSLTDIDVLVYRNDKIDFERLRDLQPTHVVISPGPGHPGNDADFGVCREVLTRQQELNCPVLGVCLGHQGIVQHLGGNVVRAPEIVHGKSSRVEVVAASPLFDGIGATFEAMRYHSLVAEEVGLPEQITVTAREAKNGLIMALQVKNRPMYGVQFHPESIGTPDGGQIMRNFLEKC